MDSNRALALIIGFTQSQRLRLSAALQANGYQVMAGDDVLGAIAALEEYEADALIIDTHIAGLTPWELIAMVDKHRPANYYVLIGNAEAFLARINEIFKNPVVGTSVAKRVMSMGA